MSAPLRITQPARARGYAEAETAPAQPTTDSLKDYMGRLVKLIPSEVVGIYLLGVGIIPQDQSLGLAVWAVVCFGLVILARAYATSDVGNSVSPQWAAVTISAISFVIWVYTLGGPFAAYNLYVPYIGSLAVLVWTFIVPIFYKGD